MTYAVAQTLLWAAEESEEGGGVDLLLPATAELIAGIIAFAIVFFFMWKWAFPAVDRMLAARQEAIAGQVKEAETAKAEAQSLLDDYRAQLAEARTEGNRIVEEARQIAESMKHDTVAKANADAEAILAKAREEATAERSRAVQDARQEVADLSIDLAEKVVGGSLDRETQLGLVERYIDELGKKA